MKLQHIVPRTETLGSQGPEDPEIAGVVCDSRQVRPGFLFVAVTGVDQDGANFVTDAVARGAVAVVTEKAVEAPGGVTRVRVADARLALAHAAKRFSNDAADKLELVGVTGTNGKTTIAYLMWDLLEAAGRRPGLLSTVQYRIGSREIPAARTTPDAVTLHRFFADMVSNQCRSAAMEVSSHALDQQRAAGVEFNAAIFTNLTRDHLDYHVTMEAYFEAKAALFRGLGAGAKPATAVINTDDPWGRKLVGLVPAQARQLAYGLQGQGDVTAENIRLANEGTSFLLRTPWGRADVRMGLMGRYNVSNALGAAAAAGALGIGVDAIAATLGRSRGAPGRLQRVPNGRGFDVFVDYAHTDDALARMLETVREATRGRLIVVFGCGGSRDRTKRPAMGAVVARLADAAVVTSDNPRREDPDAIIRDVLAGAPGAANLESVTDRRAAIAHALDLAQAGDMVVIAGKGHETFQEFANRTVAFDDAQVVRDLLAKGPAA